MTVERFIMLTFRLDPGAPDEQGYVAYCPELDIASQGEDVTEALQNIKDAALIFLASLDEMGQTEAYFKERGIVAGPDFDAPRNVVINKGEVVAVLAATVGKKPTFA
jgi:predicted RNase H-like HicB family nuclease